MPGVGFTAMGCADSCMRASFDTGNTVVYNFLGVENGGECCKFSSLLLLLTRDSQLCQGVERLWRRVRKDCQTSLVNL